MGCSRSQILEVPPDDDKEIRNSTRFSRGEIDYLYERFRNLGAPGGRVRYLIRSDFYLPHSALRTIILNEMFGDKNRISFVEFAVFLNNFKASNNSLPLKTRVSIKIKKLRLLFSMYDTNKDGAVSRQDLMDIVYRLYSDFMDIRTMAEIVNVVIKEMDVSGLDKILFDDFSKALESFDMDLLAIKFPVLK